MTPPAADGSGPARILVLEDEAVVALELEARLTGLGYRVSGTAASFDEAITAAERVVPDLLLADVRILGERDGIEVAQALRQRWGVPAVLVTAHSDQRTLQRAVEAAPLGYLTKPFREAELRATVELALARTRLERRLRQSEGETVRANAALERVTSHLRAVLRAFPDLLITLDREGTVTGVLTETHGDLLFEPGDLIGEPLESLMPATFAAGARRLLEECFRERRVLSLLEDLPPPFPPQSFEGRFVPLGEGEVLLAVRNVTQQREAERALKSSEERLRQAQKLDAIGRLAAGIAHDFNNLLTVVVGVGSSLEDEIAANPTAVELVRDILGAADRATTLTRQLLAFARVRRSAPGVADTLEVLRVFNRVLLRLLGETVELREELHPDTPPVHLDVSELEQLVLNLAVNARDAMPGGGRITVRTGVLAPGEVPNPLRGRAVLLELEDTGVGMDAGTAARVFEPFFTTKGVGEGTGLGLSTVYGIVRQAGGEIVVRSAPGKGACFSVFLPPADQPPAEAYRALTPAPRARGEVVMLVEDESTVRRAAARLLRGAGYEVLEAASGCEALEALRRKAQVDLLVTDVVMPGMSGPELVRSARQLKPGLPVLFVSGYAPDERELAELGELLLKPFSKEVLVLAVRRSLSRAFDDAVGG